MLRIFKKNSESTDAVHLLFLVLTYKKNLKLLKCIGGLKKYKHLCCFTLKQQIHLSVDLQCHLGIAVLCTPYEESTQLLLPLICQIISMRDVTFLTLGPNLQLYCKQVTHNSRAVKVREPLATKVKVTLSKKKRKLELMAQQAYCITLVFERSNFQELQSKGNLFLLVSNFPILKLNNS